MLAKSTLGISAVEGVCRGHVLVYGPELLFKVLQVVLIVSFISEDEMRSS